MQSVYLDAYTQGYMHLDTRGMETTCDHIRIGTIIMICMGETIHR